MEATNNLKMSQEDVTKLLIQLIRNPPHDQFSSNYGYDIYLPTLVKLHFDSGSIAPNPNNTWEKLSHFFYDAAWELCRRGIIRPGVKAYNQQATEGGSAGDGYSITFFGRQWLKESNHEDFVPTEPERFAQILSPYSKNFSFGFHQRAQEAIRCYGAHAYLACCTMCGAAAESILLAVSIAKCGSEEKILKIYRAASGRSRIENMLVGQADKKLKEDFSSHNSLLKYWRDESAHGQISKIQENEAYTALAMLLRFAMFISEQWSSIIKPASSQKVESGKKGNN